MCVVVEFNAQTQQVSGELREDQPNTGEIPRISSGLLPVQNHGAESDEESMYSARPESWALDHIAMLDDSDSDLEFFDAKGEGDYRLKMFVWACV